MYFDKVASTWDTLSSQERARALSDVIVKEVPNSSELIALDFGCGTGMLATELSNSFKKVFCSDLSPKMLEVLNSKLKADAIQNIDILSNSQMYSKEMYHSVDVIYSSMVFHHIIDIEAELIKLHRLLKPDGKLIIIDLDTVSETFHESNSEFEGHHGFERDKIISIVNDCGYKNLSASTVYKGEKDTKNGKICFTLFLLKAEK